MFLQLLGTAVISATVGLSRLQHASVETVPDGSSGVAPVRLSQCVTIRHARAWYMFNAFESGSVTQLMVTRWVAVSAAQVSQAPFHSANVTHSPSQSVRQHCHDMAPICWASARNHAATILYAAYLSVFTQLWRANLVLQAEAFSSSTRCTW